VERLTIYTNYKKCLDGLKQSMNADSFPWKITVKEHKEVEAVPPETVPEELETPTQSIEALIEAGSYRDALDIVLDLLHGEPSNQYAAETVGQLKNLIKTEEEIEQKLENNDYEGAILLLEKLSLEIPVGEKKDRLIIKLNEVKETWMKKIAVLQGKLETSQDFSEKLEAYDTLIEIAPPKQAKDLSRERQRFLNRQKLKDVRFKIVVLVLFIIAGAAIIFFAFFQPEMAYQDRLKAIKASLESDPGQALVWIEELQRTKDRPELRELKKKALYQVKLMDSQPIIDRAFAYAGENNFDAAFQEFNRVKIEVFQGTALPQSIREREEELRRKASAYYLERARMAGEKGEKFIYYQKALEYFSKGSAILNEVDEFLDRNRDGILSSLLGKAEKAYNRNNCKEARYFIDLCLKVSRMDRGVHSLRERIEQKCRGD
jgi:flagellar basal body-associated protein FliL